MAFSQTPIFRLRMWPSIPHLLKDFIKIWCWVLWKAFFCFYSDVHFILTFVDVINHVDWFWMLSSFCISGNNLTLLYFIYHRIRFADTCGLEFSLFYVHKISSSLSLQYLWLLKSDGLIKWAGKYSLLLHFLVELLWNYHFISLPYWWNSVVKPSFPDISWREDV